jgi:hypothetical protein
MLAGGILVYRLANPAFRFFSRDPDYWEREGVVRRGWTKVWREDNPQWFSFYVGSARFGAWFMWLWCKAFGVGLVIAATAEFLEGLRR